MIAFSTLVPNLFIICYKYPGRFDLLNPSPEDVKKHMNFISVGFNNQIRQTHHVRCVARIL